MIEQELASIMKFVLTAAENPTPLYWSVPEGFTRPSVFFPTPEIESGGETFGTYRLEYVWYLQFFHDTTEQAHGMALKVYEAIKKSRNLVKLYSSTGQQLSKGIRLAEPSLKGIDNGVVQLTIRFASRRQYNQIDTQLMQYWTAVMTDKYDGTEITRTNKEAEEE